MGVSGFLISCAMRRATSAQAALRCADCNSVMSSKVSTKPATRPPSVSAPIRANKVRRALLGPIRISATRGRSGLAFAASSNSVNSGAMRAKASPMAASRSTASKALAERLGSVTRPSPSSPTTPAETPDSTVSVKRRRSSIWL